MNDRLKKQIDFMLELDKMKNLYRQTYVLHENRRENDDCRAVYPGGGIPAGRGTL